MKCMEPRYCKTDQFDDGKRRYCELDHGHDGWHKTTYCGAVVKWRKRVGKKTKKGAKNGN